jgi:hypothetical protein
MVKIILEYADNGVIKTVTDDNSNGAGELLEMKMVYEFQDNSFDKTVEFFYDLAQDLNINTGNNHNKNTLVMGKDWGSSYTPTKSEIDKRIEKLTAEIIRLKNLRDDD